MTERITTFKAFSLAFSPGFLEELQEEAKKSEYHHLTLLTQEAISTRNTFCAGAALSLIGAVGIFLSSGEARSTAIKATLASSALTAIAGGVLPRSLARFSFSIAFAEQTRKHP